MLEILLIIDTELNEIGRHQSKLLAESLRSVPLTHSFCSPLKRARQVMPFRKAKELIPRHMKKFLDITEAWNVISTVASWSTTVVDCKDSRESKPW